MGRAGSIEPKVPQRRGTVGPLDPPEPVARWGRARWAQHWSPGATDLPGDLAVAFSRQSATGQLAWDAQYGSTESKDRSETPDPEDSKMRSASRDASVRVAARRSMDHQRSWGLTCRQWRRRDLRPYR
jgi:hypothetical protein